MMISYGEGGNSGRAAANYMLQEEDHKGEKRHEITVLRGDPFLTADIADTLDFKRTYSAGVIAWAAEEDPGEAEMDEVLNKFENLTFASMNQDQYSWSAVMHADDDGSKHIHFLIARVDLESGKAFNPAPPGHLVDYDALRDSIIFEKGWASPADPSRARLSQDGHLNFLDESKNKKQAITDFLTNRIELGLVKNRDDIISSLSELGEVTRTSKDYISVKPEGFNKAIRLKGAIYAEKFSPKLIVEAAKKDRNRSERGGIVDLERADEATSRLRSAIERRAKYNTERYSISAKNHLVKASHIRSDDLDRHLIRSLGNDAISIDRDNNKTDRVKSVKTEHSTSSSESKQDDISSVRRSTAMRSDRRDSTDLQRQLSSSKAKITHVSTKGSTLSAEEKEAFATTLEVIEESIKQHQEAAEQRKIKNEENKRLRNESENGPSL